MLTMLLSRLTSYSCPACCHLVTPPPLQSSRDANGRTALELCEHVPRAEWQSAAFLLKHAARLRPQKVEVQLMGRAACLQVHSVLERESAGELRAKVLALEGLTRPDATRVFAVWIVSERLGECGGHNSATDSNAT